MALRDAFDKLAGYFHPTVNALCLNAGAIAEVRAAAGVSFPDRPTWHSLHYPGEISLPIFLLPLPPGLAPEIRAVAEELHKEMLREGVSHFQFQINSRYENRQAHFWIAQLAKNQFLPIGQTSFVLEDRRFAENKQPGESLEQNGLRLKAMRSGIYKPRWWMQLAWLRPAYRCQRIFRHSVPYFQEWHPDFVVRDPNQPLARSLKDFPGHIFDGRVQWWDGMGSGH
ncbi:hypothetical protein CfE428DRAFT_6039 [Chthoniobacter flavus Ellin428]|uniref:Uncharacterized protein n=1 Tax=Chthoniobacter flavus Ellin428 TaxID=497964 RepID=B4DAU8_9BACT|nr:hypothetical protein [Chthoniobacter flavus]EDY16420.1 hypothetical protein CfE428DRAFT_6039 [Chthoniobacter flavus Ellin428]TCO84566.1 hypothetical protein EV701_13531 [Chthoniobacter flavus]